jgi:hypothetical protein
MQSRRDKTVFVRTQIAKFLCSLLLCNIIQAVGGLLNIAWLVENRIYVGVTCSAQAALKQIGNVRESVPLPRRVITHTSYGLRVVQQFSLFYLPSKRFAYSSFVGSGRIALAISHTSSRGLSYYSNCASNILSEPTQRKDHITESLPLATGAGSRPNTKKNDIRQTTSSWPPRLHSPSFSTRSYFSGYAATLASRDTKSPSIDGPISGLAGRVMEHWSLQM